MALQCLAAPADRIGINLLFLISAMFQPMHFRMCVVKIKETNGSRKYVEMMPT